MSGCEKEEKEKIMTKYQYVRVYIDYRRVISTDHQTSEWIIDEIKKIVPSCSTKGEEYDLHDRLVEFSLHKLDGKDGRVMHHIIQLLCEIGFEPFSTDTKGGDRRVDFRRKTE